MHSAKLDPTLLRVILTDTCCNAGLEQHPKGRTSSVQELQPHLTIQSMGLPFDWSLPPVLGPIHASITLPEAEPEFPLGEPHPSSG